MLKIGQHLANLWARVERPCVTHRVFLKQWLWCIEKLSTAGTGRQINKFPTNIYLLKSMWHAVWLRLMWRWFLWWSADEVVRMNVDSWTSLWRLGSCSSVFVKTKAYISCARSVCCTAVSRDQWRNEALTSWPVQSATYRACAQLWLDAFPDATNDSNGNPER